MPHPTEWLNEFQVNTGTAATGTQSDPHIIGLSNGNFLVAWTEAANGLIGTTAGTDMIGKIFDAEGNVIRESFQINLFRAADDELDFDIAATNDGGFVLVYVDDDIAQVNQTDVVWERRDADGNYVTGAVIATENVAADFLANPQVTVNQITNQSIVTYTDDVGTNTDINFVTVSSAGTVSAEFSAAQNGADFDRRGDVAVLTNGNLVSVYEEEDVGVTSIEFKIVTTAGAQVGNIFQTFGSDADPQVASLSGGGFVVAWDYPDLNNGEIYFRIYNNSGTPISGYLVAAFGPNLQNEVEVVALPNGGFVIVWDDDTSSVLFAQEYDATGIEVGSIQTIENVGATQPDIGVTGDGRILFTWIDVNGTGEIFASIWDPRDATINAVDYQANLPNFVESSVITTGLGSTTVNGDAFANTILGQGGNDLLYGGGGNDVIYGGAGADTIDGGGNGVVGDTVTYATATGAVQVVLDGGPATGNDAAGDVITNVENIIGSNFGDTLTGNASANFIDAGLGNDTINGLGGDDVLVGGFSQDVISGGDGDDDINGNAGNDIIDGGAGVDLGRFDTFGGTVEVNLNITVQQNTNAAGLDTISNIENLIGGIGNDRFTGTTGANELTGQGGSDQLFGLGGDDTLSGGDGNDNLQGGNGDDDISGGDGLDTLLGGGGIDTLTGGIGNDQLRGGNDSDMLTGGAGRDVLIGGDFVLGGFPGDGAADTFIFNNVTESAFGAANRDIIRDFEQGLDIIDLSTIDAITGGGDDAFSFIGAAAFSGTAGELRAFSTGVNTVVRADVDGDGAADFEIFLNGSLTMTAGDFVL